MDFGWKDKNGNWYRLHMDLRNKEFRIGYYLPKPSDTLTMSIAKQRKVAQRLREAGWVENKM